MKYFRILNLILIAGILLTASDVFAQASEEDKKIFITNEATINSANLEYSPAFYENGIVFISSTPPSKKYEIKDSRIDKNIFSIFLARRNDDGTLAKPETFSKGLTTTVHEGPVTFDRTAATMFFTRNFVTEGRRKKAKDGTVKLAIFSAENVKDDWSNVKILPFCDKESNAAHPSISVEGNLLYFSSDRPGGHGGMDLWVSRRLGDDWGEPINLGPQVNTEGEEVFPFIHADGTLYFATNGHGSTGGLDVFFTARRGDSWSKPSNLGKPFNTENDDFGFIIDRDKKNGYFSSNRPSGRGEDDIYSFYIASNLDQLFDGTKPKAAFDLEVVVSDFETGEMVEGATVTYADLEQLNLAAALSNSANSNMNGQNNELLLRIPMSENTQNGVTDSWGKLPATIMTGKHVFIIQKPGYRSRRIIVDTEDGVKEVFVSLEKGNDEDFAGSANKTFVSIPPGSSIAADGSIVGPDGEMIAPPGSTRSLPAGTTISPDGTIIGADGTIIAPAGSRIAADGTIAGADGTVYVSVDTEESFPSSIKEGTVFQLPNIYYNFNDAALRPDAKLDLDALAIFLKQYTDIEIELASHTDSRGDNRSNNKLSQRRADNVIQFLVAAGIPTSRMTAKGYGESQLRNGCSDGVECSEEQHQYNRRTDVRITKISKEILIKIVSDLTPPLVVDSSKGKSATGNEGRISEAGGSGSSDFKVVAGVFAVFENAEGRVRKLIELGYSQAQIITIGNSDKYTVMVADVNSEAEGKEMVRALKKEKINAFVKF